MTAPGRPSARLRPVPERSADFAHLTLSALRIYRKALAAEEDRVSYWRRIIQARLDLVRAGEQRGGLRLDSVRDILSDPRVGTGRTAIMAILPHEDMPPLPNLVGLWQADPLPGDSPEAVAHNTRMEHELADAEVALSAYRSALHQRIDAATGELIARYREDPTLCLSALPTLPTDGDLLAAANG
ncbi:MAG TPA: hypothetical protein VFJ21_08660 [Mycobacteriales bacterium]|jgi:hypothetical protein|nr:hypothetical protein [Mycobacteriales bacterium]